MPDITDLACENGQLKEPRNTNRIRKTTFETAGHDGLSCNIDQRDAMICLIHPASNKSRRKTLPKFSSVSATKFAVHVMSKSKSKWRSDRCRGVSRLAIRPSQTLVTRDYDQPVADLRTCGSSSSQFHWLPPGVLSMASELGTR